MKHPCRAVGCEEQVDEKYLMCRAHWAQVPPPIQAAVLEHWRDWRANPENLGLRRCWLYAARLAIRSLAGEVPEP
jgi:hypothetical protein